MSLQESIAKTIEAFEVSLSGSDRHGIEEFENQYQEMLDRGLIEETKYNLAPISTLPISAGCIQPQHK